MPCDRGVVPLGNRHALDPLSPCPRPARERSRLYGTRNTLAAPNAIVPLTSSVSVGNGQRFVFPASSVTVLRIAAK
jgi:hypothetical protein